MPSEEIIIRTYLCIWLVILGAVMGSFVECAVSRWKVGEPMFIDRSRCLSCEHILSVLDLIPIFSWLFLRGRCRYCGERIPADCLMTELAGAAGFLMLGISVPLRELGQWLIWAVLLLALSLTDIAKRVIPNELLLCLAANRIAWFFVQREEFEAVFEALKSIFVPITLLALVLLAERLMSREVMGGGDIKLLFVFSLYFTWIQQLLTLLLACLAGLAFAIPAGRKRGASVPFGPFLSVGALLTICFGNPVIEWYFSLF